MTGTGLSGEIRDDSVSELIDVAGDFLHRWKFSVIFNVEAVDGEVKKSDSYAGNTDQEKCTVGRSDRRCPG